MLWRHYEAIRNLTEAGDDVVVPAGDFSDYFDDVSNPTRKIFKSARVVYREDLPKKNMKIKSKDDGRRDAKKLCEMGKVARVAVIHDGVSGCS